MSVYLQYDIFNILGREENIKLEKSLPAFFKVRA